MWTSTTPPKGPGTEIDPCALATGIDVMLVDESVVKNAGCSGTCLTGGTSTAAAMAAGTATGFLGFNKCKADGFGIDLKDLYYPDSNGYSLWPEDPFTTPKVMGLKRLLKKSTYPRSSQILPPGHSPRLYDLPHLLNTIYNLDKGQPS